MKTTLSLFLLFATFFTACKKDNPAITDAEAPNITSIQPKDPKPGDVVTVTGTGFSTVLTDVKLTIGSNTISINTSTATEIKFTMPEGLTEGDLNVMIKNIIATINDPEGAIIKPKPATAPVPTFTALSPASGKAGDVITISGTNFSPIVAENQVSFAAAIGTASALVKTATATILTVEVPATAVTGIVNIQVKTSGAVLAAGFNGIFTVNAAPGAEDGAGTLSFFDNLKTHAYFAANDNNGNFYTLSTSGPGHEYYKLLRIDASGAITKTFEPSEFGASGTTLKINGITNDADGTIWVMVALDTYRYSKSEGRLYKIEKNKDTPEFVRNIIGMENPDLDISGHFFDMVINSKKEIFFIDESYNILFVPINGTVEKYIKPRDLITGISLNGAGLTIDQNDNLFFTAVNSFSKVNRLYKVTPAKEITPLYQATEWGFLDGTITQSKFQNLGSIAINNAGTQLYIADLQGYRLRKLDLGTNEVTTIAGIGTPITIVTVNGASKLNGEGTALQAATAPAKISLSEQKKSIYLQLGNDSWYQVYHY